MSTKKSLVRVAAFVSLVIPAVAFAHGGVDDGHVEEAVTAVAGSSALLQAFAPAWWGLLGVSALLTGGLSFGVWKFLRVPPVKNTDIREKK